MKPTKDFYEALELLTLLRGRLLNKLADNVDGTNRHLGRARSELLRLHNTISKMSRCDLNRIKVERYFREIEKSNLRLGRFRH